MAKSAELSIYIHIPFCAKRCSYCDFYSVSGASQTLIAQVLNEILVRLSRSLDELRPKRISTVFIGGGTPSLIPVNDLEPFLSKLNSCIGSVDEFSVEVNPESLDAEILHVLQSQRVDRLSMGVQSYDDYLLHWLDRPAGREALDKADALLQTIWNGKMNRDILTSLPRKKPHTLAWDIDMAIRGNPGHISLYDLTIEPNTPLAKDEKKLRELPEDETRQREWEMALTLLERQGYKRYEVSNFARPGHVCQHNMHYWNINPYLGLGPGAVSTVWNGSHAERRQEPRDILRWMNGQYDEHDRETLIARNFMFEYIMMGLRKVEGIPFKRFSAVFERSLIDIFPRTLEKYESMFLHNLWFLSLNPAGMDILNTILRDILTEMEDSVIPENYHWP